MRNRVRSLCVACGAIVVCIIVTGCNFGSRLTLNNRTYTTLTPYPLDLDAEPPRRTADPANDVASGGMHSIDPHWFNPVFYAPGIDDESLANGVFIGLNLLEADPMQIQYRLFHYRVPPGEAGSDPDLQPILIGQEVIDVEDIHMVIGVLGRLQGDQWRIRIVPE